MRASVDLGSSRRRKRKSSGRVEYNTPAKVRACLERYAPIACDPCSNARSKVKAKVRYTERHDGKSRVWPAGLTFINPPYSVPSITEWVDLAIVQRQLPKREIALLLPAATEQAWFEKLFGACDTIIAIRGRLAFDGCKSGAFFASALYYLGDRPSDFITACESIGFPLVNREVLF